LSLMSVALVFSALTQTITGALQGIGKVYVPAVSILIGCIFKVVLNVTLIRIPSINIYGAAISSIVCQIVAFLINFFVLIRYIPIKLSLGKYIAKPLVSGLVMGGVAFGMYTLLAKVMGAGYINNLIATIVSIGVSAVVYFGLVFGLRIMSKDDILLLPAGGRILKLLTKFRLYR
ncbi:MAG: polysaccharide biosynthesis C-terminal domain-containing protein, partial [Clostridia bacterium]|nr:polysaccharide biosynthesis C-terminal domain-containing protein [Clostridia bacterium]